MCICICVHCVMCNGTVHCHEMYYMCALHFVQCALCDTRRPQHVCSEWEAGWGGGPVTAGYHPCGSPAPVMMSRMMRMMVMLMRRRVIMIIAMLIMIRTALKITLGSLILGKSIKEEKNGFWVCWIVDKASSLPPDFSLQPESVNRLIWAQTRLPGNKDNYSFH